MRLPKSVRLLPVVAAMALLAGCQSYVALDAQVKPANQVKPTTQASQDTKAGVVPPAPAGWTTVFKDNFAGKAGTEPSTANWFYDIGTGYGTGEIEQTTSSTRNVYQDGQGHLVLKAIRGGTAWTSARIESTRDDFEAPAGGQLEMTASIKQPDPANGLGYWPAFWALGSPMRTGGGWPDSVIVNRTNTKAESMKFLMDGRVTDTLTEAEVGATAWAEAIDHGFFIIFDLAMGGNYPDGVCDCTAPSAATSSGASMSVGYVAVYEKGGNSTPAAKAVSTGHVTGIDARCLANQNALNTEGNPIDVRPCGTSSGQQWSAYSNRTLRVEGGCLDVAGGGTASGTDVDWYPCNGTAAQVWTRTSGGELVNPKSGRCLTDPNGNAAARLDIATCNGSAQQRWSSPSKTSAS